MNLPTINIIFDRKKKADETHKGVIEIRITYNRKQSYISTGVLVYPSEWKKDRVINRLDALSLTDRISAIKRKADRYINDCIDTNRPINVSELLSHIHQGITKESFIDFVIKRIDERPVEKSTQRRYISWIKIFENDYGKIIKFSDIDLAHVKDYDEWLHKNKRSQATIYSYHKYLRLFINDAVVAKKVIECPYSAHRFHVDRGQETGMLYLSIDEMRRVESLNFHTEYENKAKDLFIFQMYTGLSYSDLAIFDLSSCKRDDDGKYYFNANRVKTGKPYFVRILSPAMGILEKYNNKLPVICNVDYNRCLKTIGASIGFSGSLHSHIARSTFATFMLSIGTPPQDVSRMLGHTNTRQTMHYASILATTLQKDFDRAEKFLEKKE